MTRTAAPRSTDTAKLPGNTVVLELTAAEAYGLLLLVDAGITSFASNRRTFEAAGLPLIERTASAINDLRGQVRDNHQRGLHGPPLEYAARADDGLIV